MILEVTNVSKTYTKSDFHLQIDSLQIEEGQFTAILGPNGSGKSTFIKIILNLLFADSGTTKLFGVDHTQEETHEKISYLPENFSFPKNFTVRQMLHLFSEITNKNTEELDPKIGELAEAFNVDFLDKKMKDLSKGMRQTAALTHTFLGDAQFYILDEPFNGLDAVQKKAIMSYIFELQQRENIGVLITTHILSDIEKTCDRLHLIKNGVIINSATKDEILQQFDSVEAYYLSHFESKTPAT